MQSFTLVTPFIIFITTCSFVASTCWYPDGSTSEPGHVPCTQITQNPSACCASQDACSAGLCLSIHGTYRGTCTDQSWNSPNCPMKEYQTCINDPSSQRRYNRVAPILSCSNPGTSGQSVCCGYGNGSSCCGSQFRLDISGPALSPGYDILVAGLGSTGSSNTTNITTVPSSSSQDIGIKIGLGVGIPLGLLVAGLISFLFYREFNKNRLLGDPTSANVGLVSNSKRQNSLDQQKMYQDYSSPQNYPTTTETPNTPYSPSNAKAEPLYEAPVSNVHELRG
ncbi:hypothetical protein GcM1_225066 [Golovinomyces cichoracearum]|uniref:Uncharacterized protein n=1 Tax=Golovinomyces cichoracearum TaxID=62708 RepID=A0A420IQ70_9PEZI|nr:hypothetical protein GcM1_225066 [Golovinomyces cichoracearum]